MSTSTLTITAIERAYVPTSALAKSVDFADGIMNVHLADGRVVSVPMEWFPLLRGASPTELNEYEIGAGGRGIHWPSLDEDISVAGLMAGVDWEAA